MQKNNAFCIKPFTQATIQNNGNIQLCCLSKEKVGHNLKTSTIDTWWNSEFVDSIRSQMLRGEKPHECRVCYGLEDRGGTSDRQKSNQEYKIYEQYIDKILKYQGYPTKTPIEIDLGITNVCNLKCLMCDEINSSSMLTENKILKINRINQDEYKITSEQIDKIKEWIKTRPRLIRFRGGETFMTPEIKSILRWALDNYLIDETEIHITTNGTKLDAEWLGILNSIKKLRIMASVDAVGSLNEYIRYGSKWDQMEFNIKTISEIPNINFMIHTTVMNLNILHIDQLIAWCNANNYTLDYGILNRPVYYQVHNFPKILLDRAKNKLIETKNAERFLNILKTNIVKDSNSWAMFKQEITMRDAIRKNSIFDVLPELKEYWDA